MPSTPSCEGLLATPRWCIGAEPLVTGPATLARLAVPTLAGEGVPTIERWTPANIKCGGGAGDNDGDCAIAVAAGHAAKPAGSGNPGVMADPAGGVEETDTMGWRGMGEPLRMAVVEAGSMEIDPTGDCI